MNKNIKALIISRYKLIEGITFPRLAKKLGITQPQLKKLINSEEKDEYKYDEVFAKLEIDNTEDIVFSYTIEITPNHIVVGDESDYSYKFTDMYEVHEDLIEFIPDDLKEIYWNQDLDLFVKEFSEDALEALSEMVEKYGFKRYGLKVYVFDKLVYKKL